MDGYSSRHHAVLMRTQLSVQVDNMEGVTAEGPSGIHARSLEEPRDGRRQREDLRVAEDIVQILLQGSTQRLSRCDRHPVGQCSGSTSTSSGVSGAPTESSRTPTGSVSPVSPSVAKSISSFILSIMRLLPRESERAGRPHTAGKL